MAPPPTTYPSPDHAALGRQQGESLSLSEEQETAEGPSSFNKRAQRKAKRHELRRLRKQLRDSDAPIAQFFVFLGLAILCGVLAAILVSVISILGPILAVAAGICFFIALIFLFRWVYYYW